MLQIVTDFTILLCCCVFADVKTLPMGRVRGLCALPEGCFFLQFFAAFVSRHNEKASPFSLAKARSQRRAIKNTIADYAINH
jgi:hypothetical protein